VRTDLLRYILDSEFATVLTVYYFTATL